jgi:hypothetical protein
MDLGVQTVPTDSINTLTMKSIVFIVDHLLMAMDVSRPRPESIFTGTAQISVFTAAPPLLVWAVNIVPPASTKNRTPGIHAGSENVVFWP